MKKVLKFMAVFMLLGVIAVCVLQLVSNKQGADNNNDSSEIDRGSYSYYYRDPNIAVESENDKQEVEDNNIYFYGNK